MNNIEKTDLVLYFQIFLLKYDKVLHIIIMEANKIILCMIVLSSTVFSTSFSFKFTFVNNKTFLEKMLKF